MMAEQPEFQSGLKELTREKQKKVRGALEPLEMLFPQAGNSRALQR